MLSAVHLYFNDLVRSLDAAWTRFWFTPGGMWHLALLRRLVGLLALVWLASFSFELTALFGQHGLLPLKSIHQVMTSGDPTASVPGFSHLYLIQSDLGLWVSHLICLFVLLLLMLDVFPLATTPLGLLVVLSYVHRGPVLTGLFEPVLCMLLLYLSAVPGKRLVDLRRGQHRATWVANLAARLIQVHLCGFYLLIGLSKLGAVVWWTGDATWLLMTDSQHRLIDATPLAFHSFVGQGITHAWVFFDLVFPLLIWIRKARPLLIGISIVVWTWTGLVTGCVGFSTLMIVSNLAFVPTEVVEGWFRGRQQSHAEPNAQA